MKPYIGSTTLTTLALAGALSAPALAQKSTANMSREEIHDRLVALCNDSEVTARLTKPQDCEISTDGMTWKEGTAAGVAALVAAGGVGYMIRRRRKAGVATPDGGAPGVAPHDATLGDVSSVAGEPLTVEPEEAYLETLDDANARLIANMETDPRATVDDGKLKTIRIGTIEYDMTDWTPGGFTEGSFYKGDKEITIDESSKVTYLQDRSDLDHNVTESYANGTIVHFDNVGVSTIHLKNGNIVTGNLDEFGEPISGSKEYDTSGNIVAHYNESGARILGDGVSDGTSELDILDVEAIEEAPAPIVPPLVPIPSPITPAEGAKSSEGVAEGASVDTAIVSAPVLPAPVPATTPPAEPTQRWWRKFKKSKNT